MVLLATGLPFAPTSCMPIRAPQVGPGTIPSLQSTNGQPQASRTWNMPQAQEASPKEQVAEKEQLGSLIRGAWNIYRNRHTPSDASNMQTDRSDFATSGKIDLGALTDQLNALTLQLLNSQPSAPTPTEPVAEAQRKRYWPIVRNFLDNILSPTDAPSEQPDTNTLAESLENTLNRQILVGAGRQPVARTQVWSSIRKFVGDLFGKSCLIDCTCSDAYK